MKLRSGMLRGPFLEQMRDGAVHLSQRIARADIDRSVRFAGHIDGRRLLGSGLNGGKSLVFTCIFIALSPCRETTLRSSLFSIYSPAAREFIPPRPRVRLMRGNSVLLIIGGGIAAYKTLELIRRLKERGVGVRAILTSAGAEFVTPLSVSSLAGEKVFQDLFSLTDEAEMGHIELSRSADLVVVAPATADLMAKIANGHANDLASTALLATDKRVLMAPAMNVRMWNHPATQRNLATLQSDGVIFVGPDDGEMACGEYGPGRMAEPLEIVDAIEAALAQSAAAPCPASRRSSPPGPTQEPLDPVRFIANRSSGKQGYAIADALAQAGAETTLVSGPVEHRAARAM